MLPVGIKLDNIMKSMPDRVLITGLERGADAEIERMAHDHRSSVPADLGRSIGGAVIHDKNCCLRKEVADSPNHFSDALFLIEGGDQYKDVFFRDHDGFV